MLSEICNAAGIKDSDKHIPLSRTHFFSTITNTPIILRSRHYFFKPCDILIFITLPLSLCTRLRGSLFLKGTYRHQKMTSLGHLGYRHWRGFCQCETRHWEFQGIGPDALRLAVHDPAKGQKEYSSVDAGQANKAAKGICHSPAYNLPNILNTPANKVWHLLTNRSCMQLCGVFCSNSNNFSPPSWHFPS